MEMEILEMTETDDMVPEVVIVENEDEQSETLAEQLSEFNLKIHQLKSLKEVKENIRDTKYRIYLIDIHLGNDMQEEGLEIVKWLNSKFAKSNRFILVMTHYPQFDEEQCKAIGADYFQKKKSGTAFKENINELKKLFVKLSPFGNLIDFKNYAKRFVVHCKIDDIQESYFELICHIGNNPVTQNAIFRKKRLPVDMFVTFTDDQVYIGAPATIMSLITKDGLTMQKVFANYRTFPHRIFARKSEFPKRLSNKWDYIKEEE